MVPQQWSMILPVIIVISSIGVPEIWRTMLPLLPQLNHTVHTPIWTIQPLTHLEAMFCNKIVCPLTLPSKAALPETEQILYTNPVVEEPGPQHGSFITHAD